MLAVVGIAVLAVAGIPQSFETEVESGSDKAEVGEYFYYMFDVEEGTRLEFSFSADTPLNFAVLDSENYEIFSTTNESIETIYLRKDTDSGLFAFETPKADKFYFIIDNIEADASASWTYTYSVSSGRFSAVSWGGAGLVAAGAVIAFVGYLGKPKISSAPRESREGESR